MSLKEYYKIDLQTGFPMEVCLFDDEIDTIPEGYKLGWGGDIGLHKPKFDFNLNDWVEGTDVEELLQQYKDIKLAELNKECNETIVGKFTAVVDNVTYYFSCDTEAQSNFEKVDRAFEKGRIKEIAWTAYDESGYVVRLLLTPDTFEGVYLGHLNHIQSNISKYRDYLMPLVNESKKIEDINSINWD